MKALLAVAAALVPLVHSQEHSKDGSTAAQQESTQAKTLVCDTAAIDWFLPGDFEAALKKAKAEDRMLLIKGVSFGIDAAGAKCATEGTW